MSFASTMGGTGEGKRSFAHSYNAVCRASTLCDSSQIGGGLCDLIHGMTRTDKQTAATLYQLWHGIRDLKDEAASLPDEELLLLIGMLELLIEERAASLVIRHEEVRHERSDPSSQGGRSNHRPST